MQPKAELPLPPLQFTIIGVFRISVRADLEDVAQSHVQDLLRQVYVLDAQDASFEIEYIPPVTRDMPPMPMPMPNVN